MTRYLAALALAAITACAHPTYVKPTAQASARAWQDVDGSWFVQTMSDGTAWELFLAQAEDVCPKGYAVLHLERDTRPSSNVFATIRCEAP